MPKHWGKHIFTHGRFPKWVKSKRRREKKERKKERLNDGNNNGQATHGACKHAWRTQAAWAKNPFAGWSARLVGLSLGNPFETSVAKQLPWHLGSWVISCNLILTPILIYAKNWPRRLACAMRSLAIVQSFFLSSLCKNAKKMGQPPPLKNIIKN